MHVFEPHSLDSPAAPYHPIPSSLSQALAFESSLGLSNIVLVQPSCYGNDNSYLLSALRELGDRRARAVVAFDPYTTSFETLQQWHSLGVRGVRINFVSVDASMDRSCFERLLRHYADAVRPLSWVIQLYIPMKLIAWLTDFARELDVKICLDHFGAPDLSSASIDPTDPYSIPGFRCLVDLLAEGKTYVKFSAPYRVSRDPALRDLAVLALELLRVAGTTQIVFATDWPHTRFNGLSIAPFVQQCIEWCQHDPILIDRLFRGNAEDLWAVSRTALGSSNL
jgi:predicted TIM-barrel fold metal-dependent hydrolase